VNDLPAVCTAVARALNPLAIAVPERELGDGMFMRLRTVGMIRRSLDSIGTYYPLHLLGTGNPHSVLLFTAAGADSFDGLEWCQTVADPENGLLRHFQQRELLHKTVGYADDEGYDEGTLIHNLTFYSTWIAQLQAALASDSMSECLRLNFAPSVASRLEAVLHGD